jgi:abequosyltransferase
VATLSICIATFNRARFLDETLESIIVQASQDVEIIVVDGASTDDTAAVVARFADRFPRLHYYQQAINSGFDRDFDRAVALATGVYCWLMSDDDILKPGAVAAVLQAIANDWHPLVIVNAEVRDAALARQLEARRLRISEDRTYPPREFPALFAETANYLSFIGCVVIRRKLWLTRDRDRFFGSAFVHVGVIFQEPLPGAAYVIANPYITIRYGNATWTARAFEIWLFSWPKVIWSLPFAEQVKRRVCRKEPWRRLRTLLRYRALGAFSMPEYQRLIAPRASWRLRLGALLLLALPEPVANDLCVAYALIAHPRNQLLRFDLEHRPFHFSRVLRQRP